MALNLLSFSARLSPTTSIATATCQASATTFSVHSLTPPPPPPLQPPLLSLPQKSTPTPLPSSSCSLHCPHFQSCSGCTHEYNLHRPVILDEAIDFFEKLAVSGFDFDTCRLWGWRCRAKLAVRGSSTKPLIGLYQEHTHDVVDIPECKAHHPSINAAVELLKQGMSKLNIEPYDEDQGTGELRYVQMAVTTYNTSLPASQRYKNGKVQVALVWNSRNENSPSSEKLNDLASFLWRNGGTKGKVHLIHSVWANFQTSTNNIIFGNRWRHLLGERDFWEHVGGIDVSLAPSSFGQANTRAFDFLLHKLHKCVPYGASVVDLYAGAGVIGLSLAAMRKCRSVKCVEVNKESKVSFEKTVARLSETLDSSISWHHADASKVSASFLFMLMLIFYMYISCYSSTGGKVKNEKRPWILRERETSVQVKSSTVQEESRSLPETLIYISCGWDSFKEDCMSLLSCKAWYLDKAHGFNFFPGTQSIEVLAVFKRGTKPNIKRRKSGKKKRPS
ncbi:uncharacterized protein LOC111409563 [Olea europaea var. sylvestris]|uniref:uncharacterized protein LOC111409563 n=1 Tax=Olea europaea var. sylvestris TaxID=158386 RepID=UPI000C1D8C23|nr:uncharacterized protein LOC111409563 [Olea europaea var. sylvestris]